MSYFDHDDWQPADWLAALDRLAVTPPLEEIPVSSKILDAATKEPEALKPCPFCGCSRIQACQLPNQFFIRCSACHCSTPDFDKKEDAIHVWNKRPAPVVEASSWVLPPASRAALDAVTEMAVQWHWPLPRQVSDERPTIHETILVLHHNRHWEPAVASNDNEHYYIVGDRDEYYYDLTPELIWLPLPPSPEVQA